MLRKTALTLILLSTAFPAFAATRFDGSLLTYRQLTRLPASKRLQYLNELRKLLVEMENEEKEYLVADDGLSARAIHEEVVQLIKLMAVIPQAAADSVATGTPDSNALPAPDAALDPALPADPTCTPPVSACDDPSQSRLSANAKAFRASRKASDNVCIAGGFFSKYASNKKTPGTCRVLRKYPVDAKTPEFTCAQGEALCNPLLYCSVNTGGNGPEINYHCEAFGSTRANLTENCEKWYAGVAQSAQQGQVRLCDPTNTKNISLLANWEQLRNDLKSKYENWCIAQNGVAPGFQDLFCKECESMGRIFAMNKDAIGTGCASAGKNDPPPAIDLTPQATKPDAALTKPVTPPAAVKTPAPQASSVSEAAEKSKLQKTCLRCHGAGASTPLSFDNVKGMKLVFMANETHVKGKLGAKEWNALQNYLNSP